MTRLMLRSPVAAVPLLLAGFGLCVLALSGCGQSSWDVERTVVSGKVTFNGEPIQKGQIRFVPEGQTEGPVTIGQIEKGQYTIDAEGGVPVGTHRIEITAYREAERNPNEPEEIPGVEGTPEEQFIPEKYNNLTELKATIESGGPATKDFELAQ